MRDNSKYNTVEVMEEGRSIELSNSVRKSQFSEVSAEDEESMTPKLRRLFSLGCLQTAAVHVAEDEDHVALMQQVLKTEKCEW